MASISSLPGNIDLTLLMFLSLYQWHPIRPVIASVSTYGNIHIWATSRDENWSAFAPDFIELEENLDYEEKEDEFDVVSTDLQFWHFVISPFKV
jgi:hypothetical protein